MGKHTITADTMLLECITHTEFRITRAGYLPLSAWRSENMVENALPGYALERYATLCMLPGGGHISGVGARSTLGGVMLITRSEELE